jgi:hypothetical protein
MDIQGPNDSGLNNVRRIYNVQVLLESCDSLQARTKDELANMVQELSRELLHYCDMTCNAESAARFFGRKRSWIYESMSRPGTKLQRDLSEVAAREPGGLLFRLSDLARLRRELFENRDY